MGLINQLRPHQRVATNSKASLAPQILDFYPKVGIAGGGAGITGIAAGLEESHGATPATKDLVNIEKTDGNITIFNGKRNYFDWVIFNSYVTNYQRVAGWKNDGTTWKKTA